MARKESKRRDDDDGDRPAKKKPKTKKKSPLVWILAVVGILGCMCGVLGIGGGIYYYWPAGAGGGGILGPRAKFVKADIDKIEESMTLEEVGAILGNGRLATEMDIRNAFGRVGGDAGDKWLNNGRNAGVTSWRQWQNGEEFIFVGFDKGRKSGKDRAVCSFFVRRFANGFESEPGIIGLFPGDPDVIAAKREERIKLLNDPKFKVGDPKKLIVGKWIDTIGSGYDFKADGTYARTGFGRKYNGAYQFVGADQLQIDVPAGAVFAAGKAVTESYKVLVSADELILQRTPGHLLIRYKRGK